MGKFKFEEFIEAFQSLQKEKKTFVVITLVKKLGSAPQDVGARALVSSSGLEFGTVGGGKVERKAILQAQEMIQGKTAQLFVDWNLQKEKDILMTCGGTVSLFFELYEQEHPFHIAVFGAGHIAQELVPLLTRLDCQITCIDSRKEWLNKLPLSGKLKMIHTELPQNQVAQLPDGSYITIMTMGHGTDLPILLEAMKQRQRFAYVGNIGSAQKALRLKNDLLQAGIAASELDTFVCPMGESFGSNSPVEIAFSIIAQLLRSRKGSKG